MNLFNKKTFFLFFQLCSQVGGPSIVPKRNEPNLIEVRQDIRIVFESCLVLATYLNSLSKHGDF
jgi:hypothetical protein